MNVDVAYEFENGLGKPKQTKPELLCLRLRENINKILPTETVFGMVWPEYEGFDLGMDASLFNATVYGARKKLDNGLQIYCFRGVGLGMAVRLGPGSQFDLEELGVWQQPDEASPQAELAELINNVLRVTVNARGSEIQNGLTRDYLELLWLLVEGYPDVVAYDWLARMFEGRRLTSSMRGYLATNVSYINRLINDWGFEVESERSEGYVLTREIEDNI